MLSIRLAKDKSYIKVTYKGILDVDSVLHIMKSLAEHPDFSPEINRLFELSDCTSSMNVRDMKLVIDKIASQSIFKADLKVAYVSTDSIENEFLELYRTFVDRQLERKIKIFSRENEAIDWLRKPS